MELTCLVCRTVGLTVVWVTMALSCIISEKIAMNSTLPLGGSRRNTAVRFATVKLERCVYRWRKCLRIWLLVFDTIHERAGQQDGRTDRQTDTARRQTCGLYAYRAAKNNKKLSCRRETALRLVSLSILPSHPMSLTVIWNNTVE